MNFAFFSDSKIRLVQDLLIQAELRKRNTEVALKDGHSVARKRCVKLYDFIQEAWKILEPETTFVGNWHLELICAHLEAITFGTFLKMGLPNRLIINVPPGMMKSLLVSVLWPAWEWGPCGLSHLRILATSYSDSNCERDSGKMRDLVESNWYQTLWPETKLTSRGIWKFSNKKRGERDTRPFPSLTGGRGDRFLIDDPHSTETAEFEVMRVKSIRIFRESATTRINDITRSAIVIIMQRLHQHDVTGAALALNLGYIHIILPMEFDPARAFKSPLGKKWDDPRTKAGELIFPKKFPAEGVKVMKAAMGSYAVAGQFDQAPTARGGIMFKRHWFKPLAAIPAGIRFVRGWDLAASENNKKSNTGVGGPAYTCGVKLGRDEAGRFYIANVVRDQAEGAAVRTMILNTAQQDGHECEIDLPQDPGQSGKVQSQDLIAMLAGFNAYKSPETGDKISRAMPFAAQCEAGNVYYLEGQPWNEPFFSELELFPSGTFKDQVDALSRAFGRHVMVPGVVMVGPVIIKTPYVNYGDHPGPT